MLVPAVKKMVSEQWCAGLRTAARSRQAGPEVGAGVGWRLFRCVSVRGSQIQRSATRRCFSSGEIRTGAGLGIAGWGCVE